MAENKGSGVSPPGFRVDPRFINLRPLGLGGNGVVYAATDSDCDKEVAIKKLTFQDRRSCKYALRELRIMRRLQHENIITVYELLGSNGYSLEKGGVIGSNINEISSVYIVQELLHTDLHRYSKCSKISNTFLFLYSNSIPGSECWIHKKFVSLSIVFNMSPMGGKGPNLFPCSQGGLIGQGRFPG